MSAAIGGGALLDLLEPGWRRDLAGGAAPGDVAVEEELTLAAARALGEQARALTPGGAAARWPACVLVTLAHAGAGSDGGAWPAWHKLAGGRATTRSADAWGQAFLDAARALAVTLTPPASPARTPRQAAAAFLAATQQREDDAAAGAGPAVRLDPFGAGVLVVAEERGALPEEVTDPADPLLVFDDAGEPAGPALPADLVWALYPADRELRSQGPARIVISSRPPLTWRGWRLELVDLREAAWLALDGAPQRVVRGRASPVLHAGAPVRGVSAAGRPVYATLPEVALPPGEAAWRVEARRTATGAVLAAVTAAGQQWAASALWAGAPRPLLGEITITAVPLERRAGGAAAAGLRRVIVVAEGLAATFSPEPRLPCPGGLEAADAVIAAPPGMTVSPSALAFAPQAAARDITCVAGSAVQRLTVTPPHARLRIDPEPGSGCQPTAWQQGGPLLLAPADLWRGGALRIDLPGVAVPPPVQVLQRDGEGEGAGPLQVLEPTRQGRYPLRRLLDTVTAGGGLEADLLIRLGGRTAVIATVSAPGQAGDPWAIR